MENNSGILIGVTLICGLLFLRQPFSKHGFFQFRAWKTSSSVLLFFFPLLFFLKISFTSWFSLILKFFLGDCKLDYLSDFFFDMFITYRNTTNKHSWTCSLRTLYPSTEILAHSCLLSFPLPIAWKWNLPRCISNDEWVVKI